LALLVGAAFAVLLLAIGDLRGAERRNRHAQDVLVAANQLERLLLDLETGTRGFVLTRQERFLEPWQAARLAFPRRAATLRALVRPVRRAALMAGRLAGGDLAARMPETGAGEIGALERAFNVMGSSLERSRDELAQLASEQAALRRVATLVAQGRRLRRSSL